MKGGLKEKKGLKPLIKEKRKKNGDNGENRLLHLWITSVRQAPLLPPSGFYKEEDGGK